PGALGELLRYGAPGVVAVQQNPGRDHHEGDHDGLPDERELVWLTDEYGTERNDLRVDVETRADEGDFEHGVEGDADRQDDRRQADQRVTPHERVDGPAGLQLPENPDGGEIWAEVEHDVPDHQEGFDRRRQRHQRPVLGPVPQLRVVDRERRPVHDGVLPDDQRADDAHQQHR